MGYALLVAGAAVCALMAIRSTRLLSSALWLAAVSGLVSLVLYTLGAHMVAVIELSVGAGLVTVLFVFAINIAGDEAMSAREIIPKPVMIGLVLAFVALLAWMALPVNDVEVATAERTFEAVLWSDRAIDVMLQIVLIFSGVLCLVGLFDERSVQEAEHAQAVGEKPVTSGMPAPKVTPGDDISPPPTANEELAPEEAGVYEVMA